MNARERRLAAQAARAFLPQDLFERLEALPIRDLGFGFDPFGMEKEAVLLGAALGYLVHRYYFRVQSRGHDRLPAAGRMLITPNHSGVLPFDGTMIWSDLLIRMDPPRLIRAVVDNFFAFIPYLGTMLNRVGQVVGARRNFEDLLEGNETVVVFPEGAKGTGKFFWQRYRLLRFNVGFIELALRYRAPIVPTAVVGGEEQAPMFANIKPVARMLGLPYFPITPLFPHCLPLGALPLPVQYHIEYGEPLHFYRDYGPEAADDPEVTRMLADRVRLAVETMLERLLDERESVFGFDRLPRQLRGARREFLAG